MSVLGHLDTQLARPVPLRPFAVLRILVGLIAVAHLWPHVTDAMDGHIYRDAFYESYAGWYPELSRDAYTAALWVGVLSGLAMAAGLASRVAAVLTLAVVAYHLGLSTTHFHNHVAYLVIVLTAVAAVPSGRECSADSWVRQRAGRPPLPLTIPAWPVWLLRFEAAVVYGASGVSKLFDPDWFGGTVTWGRVNGVRDRMASETPVPHWAISVLTDRDVHTYAAKVIVLTEVLIAVGLWWRPTRLAAVWLAVVFHVAIEMSATVRVFSYLGIAALVIWTTPTTRDRTVLVDPSRPGDRRVATLVARLDWLARFRLVEDPGAGAVRVVDRDGSLWTGRPALALLASRLPATAPVALPVLAWYRVACRRSGVEGAGVGRDVDGVLLESGQGDDLQRPYVG